MQEVATGQNARPVNRHRFGHNHCRATHSPFQQVAAKLRAGEALIGHIGGVRPKNDAVAQGVAAQLKRLHQAGMFGHAASIGSDRLGRWPARG